MVSTRSDKSLPAEQALSRVFVSLGGREWLQKRQALHGHAVFLAVAVIMGTGFLVALTLPNAELGDEVPAENETKGDVSNSLD